MAEPFSFLLNGRRVTVLGDGGRSLASVLREDLGLTGTKVGCGAGLCMACTVLLDRVPIPSCSTPLASVDGHEILTIEGLATRGVLHPVQEAFLERAAFQCGFCTPGMILAAVALLEREPRPGRAQVVEALEGHLCRCGSHTRILDAVQEAAGKGSAR
jgi:aerobic-type carbon monoxide dehydrogenase small subunit (CoxS/CutS family)